MQLQHLCSRALAFPAIPHSPLTNTGKSLDFKRTIIVNDPAYYLASSSFTASRLQPPQPYAIDIGDLHIVFSDYGHSVPFEALTLLYIDCMADIWQKVAHETNTHHPPDAKPVENQAFLYEDHGFQFVLAQSHSAIVDWEYGELFDTLSAIMGFAVKYRTLEMDIRVVVRGLGNFEGYIKYTGVFGGDLAVT